MQRLPWERAIITGYDPIGDPENDVSLRDTVRAYLGWKRGEGLICVAVTRDPVNIVLVNRIEHRELYKKLFLDGKSRYHRRPAGEGGLWYEQIPE